MLGCNSHSKYVPLRSATDDVSGRNSNVIMSLLMIVNNSRLKDLSISSFLSFLVCQELTDYNFIPLDKDFTN